MNDTERWRTVAAWFEEAAETGVPRFESGAGLCRPTLLLGYTRCYGALYEVRREVNAGYEPAGLFLGPTYPDRGWRDMARVRATLALLMAHMAEDDGGNHYNEEA